MFFAKHAVRSYLNLHYSAASRFFSTSDLQKLLGINNSSAKLILHQNPCLCKIKSHRLQEVIKATEECGLHKSELITNPTAFSLLPITLKNRYKVLKECGFSQIDLKLVSRYFSLVKNNTVTELKKEGFIPHDTDVAKNLAGIFTSWPTSHSQSLLKIKENECNLLEVRMKILQRYLELVIDLSEDEFNKKVKVYVRIKHKPFETFKGMLNLLINHLLMSPDKIKSNLFVIHADPENITQLICQVPTIGNRSIKDIIKQYPKLCTTNYENVVNMRKLFQEYGFSEDQQRKCPEIFTLSCKTIKERLDIMTTVPEFQILKHHPRVLKIIVSEKVALKRLKEMDNMNKKCYSLNFFAGSEVNYKKFQETPGEITKGSDLLRVIHTHLHDANCSLDKVKDQLKRHPFWLSVPLLHAVNNIKFLDYNFSYSDILANCTILLYPREKIEKVLKSIANNKLMKFSSNCDALESTNKFECVDLTNLSKSQTLSLALYLLEKDHHFSGNGIWTHDIQNKDMSNKKNFPQAESGTIWVTFSN